MRYSFQCFLSSQATECGTRPRWQKQVLFSSAKYLWNFLVKFMIDEKLFWLATTTWYHAAPLLTPKQLAGVTPGVVRVAPMQLMSQQAESDRAVPTAECGWWDYYGCAKQAGVRHQ